MKRKILKLSSKYKIKAVFKLSGTLRATDARFKTLKMFRMSQIAKFATAAISAVTHLPQEERQKNIALIEATARNYDNLYALKQPNEVISFVPTDVPQEIIDKHTLKLSTESLDGRLTMDDLTQFDYSSLRDFSDALEEFIKTITHQCDKMESGITYSQNYMKDESSGQILRKANQVVMDIRACINPTVKINQKILDIIETLETGLTQ